MIQRKQSLFLLVAVIAYVLCLFLPVGIIQPEGMGTAISVHCLGTVNGEMGMSFDTTCAPLFLLCAVSALLSLVTIFMYKNRKLQINLCNIILLFSVLWYIDYLVMYFDVVGLENATGKMGFTFGSCLPLVGIILTWMARKGVSDDEKLVRVADRIR